MLNPVEMQKFRAIAMRDQMNPIISELHEAGMIQFTEPKNTGLQQDAPLPDYFPLTEQLVRFRGIEAVLKPKPITEKTDLLQVSDLLNECASITIDKKLSQIRDRLAHISAEESLYLEAALALEHATDLGADLSLLDSSSVSMFIGRISTAKLQFLETAVSSETTRFFFKSKKLSPSESFCVLVVDKKFNEKISAALQKAGFTETRLQPMAGTPAEALDKINSKITSLAMEKSGLTAEVDSISEKNYARISTLREMLEIYSERSHAPAEFVKSDHTFVFEGWMPKAKFDSAVSILKQKFGNSIAVFPLEAEKGEHGHESHDEAPVLLNNPKSLSPFQYMVEFISIPKGHDLDPTFIFAMIFPIFYGMMLGDAGYGVVSFFLAYFLASKFKGGMLGPISRIWLYASIPTIIFGIIFNEYFGFTHEHLLGLLGVHLAAPLYTGLSRLDELSTLLIISILVGAATVAIGYLLGAIVKWREGEKGHAIAKIGWLFFELAGIGLVMVFFKALPGAYALPLGLVAILGLIPIFKAEGVNGAVEIPGLAGNILSFARIAAVGVSSVIVAELINELLLPTLYTGVIAILLIPIYIGLHLFNIFLGMFESLIQGARLNYVEFFSKFYEGGGKPFAPFSYARKLTKEKN